jgi:hypothetical protein
MSKSPKLDFQFFNLEYLGEMLLDDVLYLEGIISVVKMECESETEESVGTNAR